MTTPNQPSSRTRRWVGMLWLAVLAVIGYELVTHLWLVNLPQGVWVALDVLILVGAALLVFIIFQRARRWEAESVSRQAELEAREAQLAEATRLHSVIFDASQQLIAAGDEEIVINLLLELAQQVVGAQAASFVPLDDRAQPLPARSYGEMPLPAAEDWLEYLAAPEIRQRCASCHNREQTMAQCPLLVGSYQSRLGVYCVPLRRGEREYGVLNLYLPPPTSLAGEKQEFLRRIVDEATLVLEGIRLRRRELAALRQLQTMRERTDLQALLGDLLRNLAETMESDFGLVVLDNQKVQAGPAEVLHGELPSPIRALVDGVLNSVITTGEPVALGNVSRDEYNLAEVRALMAAPMMGSAEAPIGAILVASQQVTTFAPRQLSMLQTIANQAALMVQNVNLVRELEYQTMMAERTRLAREIHDGLAQTLGFLKLKLSQMQNYLEFGEIERLQETLPVCYETLADAYQEARQAIDGLRITSDQAGLQGWLKQTVTEFSENSGLPVKLVEPVDEAELPPEVHAQLIRIVQEALNNIRKHAAASQAWVSCQRSGPDLVITVGDDGHGFVLADVGGHSQHGLHGMQERTELIGGDFQVTSRPGEGTTVYVRLPLVVEEGQQ